MKNPVSADGTSCAETDMNSPLSYLPFVHSSAAANWHYSAISLTPTFQVDSDSLHRAASQYSWLSASLQQLVRALQLVEYPLHPLAGQVAAQVGGVLEYLRVLVAKTLDLEALLRHAGWLYAEQEARIANLFPVSWERPAGFPQTVGTRTTKLLSWAEDNAADEVSNFDALLTAFLIFQQLPDKFTFRFSKYRGHARFPLANGYFFFFSVDFFSKRNFGVDSAAVHELLARKTLVAQAGDDDLRRSSALLFHTYTTIEKIRGTYQPHLLIDQVTKAQFLDNRTVLLREDIHYSGRPVAQLLADASAAPSSSPAGGLSRPLERINAPLSLSALVQRVEDLKLRPTAPLAKPDAAGKRRAGEIEIIKYQPGGGQVDSFRGRPRTSFSVVMYGTQEWLPGSVNPQDMTTNFAALGGIRTDQEAAVLVALEKLGAQPGDRIEFVGHSQAGLESAALSVNSEINAKYEVVSVVSAGGPVSRFEIPESVRVLALEHLNDPTPALDAAPNPLRKNWLSYSVAGRPLPATVAKAGAAAYVNHDLEGYLQALRRLEQAQDPQLAEHNQERLVRLGITETTQGEVYRFQVLRGQAPPP